MLVLIVIGLCLVYMSMYFWKRKNLPPGPFCLPIVGYLPWINPKMPYKTLHDLAKKYGSIYGLHLGNIYTIVLSDAKIIRSVLSKNTTTGRAPLFLTHGLMKGYGLICAEGDLWKDQRKFVYGCLRQIGGTKVSSQREIMETLIQKHTNEFLEHVASLGNKVTLSPSEHLRHSLGSFMNSIVFGESWSKDDEIWKYLQHLQEEGIKHIGIAGPLNFIPILSILPKYRKNVEFLENGLRNTHKIYDDIIKKHQQILDEKLREDPLYEPFNFLEAFLKERENKKNAPEGQFYNDIQLRYLLADLFGAGLDTTLTTLNWFILYMSLNRDVQKKIHDQLMTSQSQLLEATIAEVQRIRSTVPIGIPHGTLAEIQIDGYTIPANSMIVPLQWAVHMDENIWKNPEEFNPYRFINDDGNFFKPDEAFIPFQIGQRMCVGAELAKMLLNAFCSSILINFELSIIGDVDLMGNCGITLTPNEYEIIFTKYV